MRLHPWTFLMPTIFFVTTITNVTGPFARSLVVCDRPPAKDAAASLDAGNSAGGTLYSGSAHCGDRLQVIGEGSRLTSRGNSLNSVGKLLSWLLGATLADWKGRRAAALCCTAAVTLACISFVLAALVPAFSSLFFLIAYTLLGLSGIDFLGDVVAADLGLAAGKDAALVFQRKEKFFMLIQMSGMVFGTSLGSMELQDFTVVWICIAFGSLCIFLLSLSNFPETAAALVSGGSSQKKTPGFKQLFVHELVLYRTMLQQRPVAKWSCLANMFYGTFIAFLPLLVPFLMAYFQYTQAAVSARCVPMFLCQGLFAPLVPSACIIFGHRRAFTTTYILRGFIFLCSPILALHWSGMWIWFFMHTLLFGQNAIERAVEARYIGAEKLAKFKALCGLCAFTSSAFCNIAYSILFDAKATTLGGKMQPLFFMMAGILGNQLVWWTKTRHMHYQMFDELEEESGRGSSRKKGE